MPLELHYPVELAGSAVRFRRIFWLLPPIKETISMIQYPEDLAEVIELTTERYWLAGLSLPDAKSQARAEVSDTATPPYIG